MNNEKRKVKNQLCNEDTEKKPRIFSNNFKKFSAFRLFINCIIVFCLGYFTVK
jgi:hypothetical protein